MNVLYAHLFSICFNNIFVADLSTWNLFLRTFIIKKWLEWFFDIEIIVVLIVHWKQLLNFSFQYNIILIRIFKIIIILNLKLFLNIYFEFYFCIWKLFIESLHIAPKQNKKWKKFLHPIMICMQYLHQKNWLLIYKYEVLVLYHLCSFIK